MSQANAPIMVLKDIVKTYGATHALDHASLRIYPGEVHALMGANGAGKSTIISIISGANTMNSGSITLRGKEVKFKNTIDSRKNGIACVYQELSLLPHLTVAENLTMNNPATIKNGFFDWNKSREISRDALGKLGTTADEIELDVPVSALRADQQQMIEIARAISYGADIILLDEPTSSLNFDETNKLFEVIQGLCKQGIGIIFVSHRMNEIRQICDRVTIFKDGKTVVDGVMIGDKSDSELIRDMIGTAVSTGSVEKVHKDRFENKENILKVTYQKNNTSCTLKKGEIVGVAGLAGSGRSALLRTIWGVNDRKDMELAYLGEKYTPKSPKDSLRRDIAYIGEDRAISGLFLDLPITETVMMPNRIYDGQKLVRKGEAKKVEDVIHMLKVKIPAVESAPRALSGGNQQKLLFGKWFINTPKLFLLDEPTRGVDIHTKQDIYKLIRQLSEQGSASLVVSSEISELVELCHKIMIVRDGHLERILTGDDINEDYIMACITMADTQVKEEN